MPITTVESMEATCGYKCRKVTVTLRHGTGSGVSTCGHPNDPWRTETGCNHKMNKGATYSMLLWSEIIYLNLRSWTTSQTCSFQSHLWEFAPFVLVPVLESRWHIAVVHSLADHEDHFMKSAVFIKHHDWINTNMTLDAIEITRTITHANATGSHIYKPIFLWKAYFLIMFNVQYWITQQWGIH